MGFDEAPIGLSVARELGAWSRCAQHDVMYSAHRGLERALLIRAPSPETRDGRRVPSPYRDVGAREISHANVGATAAQPHGVPCPVAGAAVGRVLVGLTSDL